MNTCLNFKGGYINFIFCNQIRLDKNQWRTVQSVHRLPGDCPWTLSSPPGLSGLCPGCPWTMSRMSTQSMDIVQFGWSHFGLCPECPWTLSRLSTESMVNVYWVHGLSTEGILLPVTDNCITWISSWVEMPLEMISWPISIKECFAGVPLRNELTMVDYGLIITDNHGQSWLWHFC